MTANAKNTETNATDAKDIPAQNQGETEVTVIEEAGKTSIVVTDGEKKASVLSRLKTWAKENKNTLIAVGGVLTTVVTAIVVTSNNKKPLELTVSDEPAEDTDTE